VRRGPKKTPAPRLILILNPNRNPGSLNADFLNALSCKRSDTQNAESKKKMELQQQKRPLAICRFR